MCVQHSVLHLSFRKHDTEGQPNTRVERQRGVHVCAHMRPLEGLGTSCLDIMQCFIFDVRWSIEYSVLMAVFMIYAIVYSIVCWCF